MMPRKIPDAGRTEVDISRRIGDTELHAVAELAWLWRILGNPKIACGLVPHTTRAREEKRRDRPQEGAQG